MSPVPRIRRVVPEGDVTRPDAGIPVLALLRWQTARVTEVEAVAVAWTRSAVEIRWTTSWGDERTDWIDAADVRRAEAGPGRAGAAPRRRR